MSQSIFVKYKGLEILCKPGTIIPYRMGKLSMSDVIITDDAIYKNVKKGDCASEQDIIKVFGEKIELKDAFEVMLQKGDFQMTTKERQYLIQRRRLKLLDHFHQNYVNPENNSPHPISRLDNVFNEIKAKINFEMQFDKNCEEIRKILIGFLPLKPKDVNTIHQYQSTNKNKYDKKNKRFNK